MQGGHVSGRAAEKEIPKSAMVKISTSTRKKRMSIVVQIAQRAHYLSAMGPAFTVPEYEGWKSISGFK